MLAFYMILKASGGEPSPEMLTFHDLKKKDDFYYFSSCKSGLAHFMGKPPCLDNFWHNSYFVVTPSSGQWPFPCPSWWNRTPRYERIGEESIPSSKRDILERLNWIVESTGHLRMIHLLKDNSALSHFGFLESATSPSPGAGTFLCLFVLYFAVMFFHNPIVVHYFISLIISLLEMD